MSWDTSRPKDAQEADIPALYLTEYFTTGSPKALDALAVTLRAASEEVGFSRLLGTKFHQAITRTRSKWFAGCTRCPKALSGI